MILADEARVGTERHLEQPDRRTGRSSRIIMSEARIETGRVDLVVEQVVHRVLECPGQELPGQVTAEQRRLLSMYLQRPT